MTKTRTAAADPPGHRWRADIQALRGWAVVVVILFHADLDLATSGYLGVDIFFVVSGFLIGGIVIRGRQAGHFRFGEFYLRRLRRLFPASATVMALTTIAAIALLTASEYERFWPQLEGALTFSTNIILWRQINYFNDSAVFEPLLHMWSLGVEEQFYLLFPVSLAIIPRRLWLPAAACLTIASLAGYLWLYPQSPGAAFYLLPTRAWEIGFGTLAALLTGQPGLRHLASRLRPVALCVIVALPFIAPPAPIAFLLAIPACLATVVILLAEPATMSSTSMLRPLTLAGDMSYSLYLVHWPLIAFSHVLYLGAPIPARTASMLVGVTVVLAFPLYRAIERPARRAAIPPRNLCLLMLAASLAIAILGYGGLRLRQALAPTFDVRGIVGLGVSGCDADAERFDGRCTRSATPDILIWGDSFSQHIVPAIEASTDHAIAQASKGGCAPLIGLAPVDLQASKGWARGCIAFNDSVLHYLARTPSVRVVVLSARYLRYRLSGTRALMREPSGQLDLGAPTLRQLIVAQARTSGALHALGKRVIIVGAPPQANFDVGLCWERRLGGLPLIEAVPNCAITGRNAHPAWPWTLTLMDMFAARAGTTVLRIDQHLCQRGQCETAWDGTPLYRDGAHLGHAGSILLGRYLHLGERVWRDAR